MNGTAQARGQDRLAKVSKRNLLCVARLSSCPEFAEAIWHGLNPCIVTAGRARHRVKYDGDEHSAHVYQASHHHVPSAPATIIKFRAVHPRDIRDSERPG